MKQLLLFFSLACGATIALAQPGAFTTGDGSPILIGAQNKVNYIRKVDIRNNIPESLAPYLAGLIFANKNIRSDSVKNINASLQVWMNKYFELQRRIAATADSNKKMTCQQYLDLGDFTSVENVLKISTDFRALKKQFPNTYQTHGSESPIIIGDYGTVTYVVDQIITYNLPEGLTSNILVQLRVSQDSLRLRVREVSQLRQFAESREIKIREYITKYRIVEKQLQSSPDLVNKRVLALFNKQDFDGALRELERARGSDAAIANNELIRARILMLQLNYQAYDSSVMEINKAYRLCTTFAPTYDRLLEYGKFLDEYDYIDTSQRITILTQAYDSANTLPRKILASRYLSDAYMSSDLVKAKNILERALDLLRRNEPITDSLLTVNKAIMELNLGRTYIFQRFDTINYVKALQHSLEARRTLQSTGLPSADLKYYLALFDRNIAYMYFVLQDSTNAIDYYKKAIAFYEAPEHANLTYFTGHVRANLGLASLYSTYFQLDKANAILLRTIQMIQTDVSLRSRIYVQEIEETYTVLITNELKMNKMDEALRYSEEFRNLITPFMGPNSKEFYSIALAEVDVDLGAYYLQKADYPRCKEMLQGAYDFYIADLSGALKDKQKFVNCIYYLHEYYVNTNETIPGIQFNQDLLARIVEYRGSSFDAFTDLESQVQYQLSELFYNVKRYDSAETYIRTAIATSELKSRQQPVENIKSFAIQTNGLLRIMLRRQNSHGVDSLTDSFITSCASMSNSSPWVRDHYRAIIGTLLSTYGAFIDMDIDSVPVKDPMLVKRYLGCEDRIFDAAAQHFEVAKNDPSFENKWDFAMFSYQWAQQQYRWESHCAKADIPAHHKKRDDLLAQALQTANTLPPTPFLDNFRQNVNTLSQKPQIVLTHN